MWLPPRARMVASPAISQLLDHADRYTITAATPPVVKICNEIIETTERGKFDMAAVKTKILFLACRPVWKVKFEKQLGR